MQTVPLPDVTDLLQRAYGSRSLQDVEGLYRAICGMSRRLGLEFHEAQDMAQKVLEEMFRCSDRWPPTFEEFCKFAVACAFKRTIDLWRMQKRRKTTLDQDCLDRQEGRLPESSAVALVREAKATVLRILERLPEDLFHLARTWKDGRMDVVLAAEMGQSVPQLQAGKKRLERELRKIVKELRIDMKSLLASLTTER